MRHSDGLAIVEQCCSSTTTTSTESSHVAIRTRLTDSSGRASCVNLSTMDYDYEDPVHGKQRFPAIVLKIINTTQFQRLNHIKQLGVCDYVFPSATHSRFEHSLGVCFMVIRYLNILKTNSGIRNNDDLEFYELCVILAGLLHDIGHGPFSHMWEPFVRCGNHTNWAHEDTSCDVVKHLFAINDIRLDTNPKRHQMGVDLIVALIRGDVEGSTVRTVLGNKYHYLTEIVNNKYCLIDVDKWDYMVRDIHHLNATERFDGSFARCFEQATVVQPSNDGRTHIAFHVDTLNAVRSVFATRAQLHAEFYQERRVIAIEMLLRHVFLMAEQCGYLFRGTLLTECQGNMRIYEHLNDTILNDIEQSTDERMQRPQRLLQLCREKRFRTEFEEQTHILTLKWINNTDADGSNENDDMASLSYQLHLPDKTTSMPSTVTLYRDDGTFYEMNPRKTKDQGCEQA